MAKELKNAFGRMQDSSAVNADTLDELIEENGNYYCVEAQQEGINILERTFIPDSTMRFRRVI